VCASSWLSACMYYMHRPALPLCVLRPPLPPFPLLHPTPTSSPAVGELAAAGVGMVPAAKPLPPSKSAIVFCVAAGAAAGAAKVGVLLGLVVLLLVVLREGQAKKASTGEAAGGGGTTSPCIQTCACGGLRGVR